MGNPYYVAPQGNMLGNVIDPYLKLRAMDQQERGLEQQAQKQERTLEQNAAQLAEMKRQHMVSSFGTETPAPGAQTLDQQRLGIQQQGLIPKDPNLMPFTPSTILQSKAAFKQSIGLDDKDVGEIFDIPMKLAQDANVRKGEAYDILKTQGPQLQQITLQKVSDLYEKKLSDPKNGQAFAMSAQAKNMETFIDSLASDPNMSQTIDSLFPDVARNRAEMEANSRAALMESSIAGKLQLQDIKNTSAKEIADAKLQMAGHLAGVRAAGRQERLLPVDDGQGNTIYVPQSEAAGMKAPRRGGAGESPANARTTSKSVADAEGVILKNKSSQEATGRVDYFNQFANKPYAYTWKDTSRYVPGTDKKVWDSGSWDKVQLPVIKGRQVTAKDVYDTAAKHGMTYDEVIGQIMKR